MPPRYRLKLICPRYLLNHAGGAEVLCRQFALRLAAAGHQVTLMATTAVDAATWAADREPCTLQDGPLTVRLFAPDPRPELPEFRRLEGKIAAGDTLTDAEEALWIRNSVNSASLLEAIRESIPDTDFFIFIPYLFGTTLTGTQVCPEKSVLIPCLHDENFARLRCMGDLFHRVRLLLFNAPPEMDLARKLYDLPALKCAFVSLGFDPPGDFSGERFRKKYNLVRPYITFAGRREAGKNFHYLLEMFRVFRKAYPGKLDFVTMGSETVHLDSTDTGKVHDLGFVSEQDKLDAFAGALINCQPSTNESFSITIMESWLCGRPVLVNGHCNVTAYWVRLCRGGLIFSDYFEFEQALIYALEQEALLKEMAENGRFFVAENFSWPVILQRFEQALALSR